MAQALDHRGPDGDGAFADDGVALGFRRLAIIDL
jgi:asparagine synthase (glutamine-hydrolysing)